MRQRGDGLPGACCDPALVIDAWAKENDTRFYAFEQELLPVGVETMPPLVNRYEGQRQLLSVSQRQLL